MDPDQLRSEITELGDLMAKKAQALTRKAEAKVKVEDLDKVVSELAAILKLIEHKQALLHNLENKLSDPTSAPKA
jgi:hypothetical protein